MPRLLSFLIVIILCLFSAELSLRIYNTFSPSFIFYSDDYNRFRGQPGQHLWGFPLNKDGFMDKDFVVEKTGNYRILALGDSFTFGIVPYPDNFLTRLESKLQQQGADIEIYNMGITQTGPRDQLSLLLREGLQYQPDMVLLSFFIGNDFAEVTRRQWWEKSYLASFVYYVFGLYPQFEKKQFGRDGEYCDDCSTLPKEKYLFVERRRSMVFREGDERFLELLAEVESALLAIKKVCEQHDIKLLVSIIPDELQVNKALFNELHHDFMKAEVKNWNLQQPNEKLAGFFTENDIAFIDLTPGFIEAAENKPLYKPNDSHWNIAGNRLAAELLEQRLSDILPASVNGEAVNP